MAIVCLLLNTGAVSAASVQGRRGGSRLLQQVTATSQAVPALEVAAPAPRAEASGPLVPGPEGEAPVSASQALFNAIRARNLSRVQQLLAQGANTDVYSAQGTTPLIEAIALGEAGIFNAIMDKGVNTNLPSRPDGNTPLFYAITVGNLQWATRLLDAGADINLANSAGDTPLLAALKQTPVNYQAVELLLSRRPSPTTSAADLTKTDAQGRTAMQIAQASGDPRLIALFSNLAPAGEAMPAVATTAGRGTGATVATAPVLLVPPVAEIIGFAPTSEAGAFPLLSAPAPVAEITPSGERTVISP